MKCPNCGKEIANDSQFCEYCGAQLKNAGKVDVRWALLPVAIMSAFAVWLLYECGSEDLYVVDYFLLTLIPFIIIFAVTLWLVIKKKVPISFFILITIVFISCTGMIYERVNAPSKIVLYNTIYADSDSRNCRIDLLEYVNTNERGSYNTDDIDEAERSVSVVSKDVCSSLTREGKKNVHTAYFTPMRDHKYDKHNQYDDMFLIAVIAVVLYIVYSIIAYKKQWKF